jgi:hypothetical protein
MLDKVFQDKKKIMWVRLNDYNYPRIALFLPEKYTKEVMCKARNSIFREHNATKNTFLKVPIILLAKHLPRNQQTHQILY